MQLRPQLERLATENPNLRLRQVELPRSGSPVGAQFGIRSVPYLILYEGRERVAEGLQESMLYLMEQQR